jgi:hypothetical protein
VYCLRLLEVARTLLHPDYGVQLVVNTIAAVPIRLARLARFLQSSAHMNTTTLQLRNVVERVHVRLAFLLIPFACFAFSPQARATCQQGCLTNSNTVLGNEALLNNTDNDNTAIGFNALSQNSDGSFNTATGFGALESNTTGSDNTAFGGVHSKATQPVAATRPWAGVRSL